MPQLVIVADDLTGAADTGACFAGAGFATVIPLSGTTIPDADVVVLSTDSRDMSASDAARAVTAAIARVTVGEERRLRAAARMQMLLGSTRRSTPRCGVTLATSCWRRWKPLAQNAR